MADPRDEALDILHHTGPLGDGCRLMPMTLYTGGVICP